MKNIKEINLIKLIIKKANLYIILTVTLLNLI